jgi:uncharacterized RDD family membrane protein YckC
LSILPLPEPSHGEVHLSALESYLPQPGTLIGVTFWPRVAARLIDLVVHYILSFGTGILFGILVSIAAMMQHASSVAMLRRYPSSSAALFVMALIGSIVFETICEGIHGSTPGKMVLGFMVVQADGTPCRFKSAFIRSLAYCIDSLFFGLIGYMSMHEDVQQRRHGDDWAETVVVRRSQVAPQNLRSGGTFVAGLLIASMVYAALVLAGLMVRFIKA